MRGGIAMQVADLAPAHPEPHLAATSLPGAYAGPGRDDVADLLAGIAVRLGEHDRCSVSGRPENVCTTHIVPVRSVVLVGERLGEAGELLELGAAEGVRQPSRGGGDLRIDAMQEGKSRFGYRRDGAAAIFRVHPALRESP